MIGFGSDEESVDEACGGAREAEGGDEAELVDIGGDNVGLLGELGGAAYDAVAAVGDIGDQASAVVEELERDVVADGDRVGLLAAADTEIATETAVERDTIVGQDSIPTTCCSDN